MYIFEIICIFKVPEEFQIYIYLGMFTNELGEITLFGVSLRKSLPCKIRTNKSLACLFFPPKSRTLKTPGADLNE